MISREASARYDSVMDQSLRLRIQDWRNYVERRIFMLQNMNSLVSAVTFDRQQRDCVWFEAVVRGRRALDLVVRRDKNFR